MNLQFSTFVNVFIISIVLNGLVSCQSFTNDDVSSLSKFGNIYSFVESLTSLLVIFPFGNLSSIGKFVTNSSDESS